MNIKTILLTAMLAAFSATTVHAAESAVVEKKAEEQKTEKAEAKKSVKRHNHAAERTGMPASESTPGKSHHETMDKDMPMHDHTKDKH